MPKRCNHAGAISFFSRAKSFGGVATGHREGTPWQRGSQGEGYWEDAGLGYYGEILVLGWGTGTLGLGTVV